MKDRLIKPIETDPGRMTFMADSELQEILAEYRLHDVEPAFREAVARGFIIAFFAGVALSFSLLAIGYLALSSQAIEYQKNLSAEFVYRSH